MDFVQPIRDKKKIAQIKNLLRGEKRYRDLLFFVVGVNSALRVSDLLALRVGDFVDADGTIRDSFVIHDQKTGKRNEVHINQAIREALVEYLAAYPGVEASVDHALFFNPRHGYRRPIQRTMAWQIVSEVCQAVGLRGNFGTHTLRKTWGYQARMAGVPLELIMHKLNHSNAQVTKRYLGITDEEIGEVVRRLNL